MIAAFPVGAADLDPREEMRRFVIELRAYADLQTNDFIIIPQNGQELITDSGEPDGIIQSEYLSAIDGSGREDLFYGYEHDDEASPAAERQYLYELCRLYEKNDIEVLVTDYCSSRSNVDSSYRRSAQAGFTSFAADNRELISIPAYPEHPYKVNNRNITALGSACNFLYLINGEAYKTKTDFVDAVVYTDYDLLIIDLFHNGDSWNAVDLEKMKTKARGGRRLLICYMSIGEAEDYRYYWRSGWQRNNPGWLESENPHWEGNYKVRYWDEQWKKIIYGNNGSYLKKIIDAGFDGVYLDIIDAFEYFE